MLINKEKLNRNFRISRVFRTKHAQHTAEIMQITRMKQVWRPIRVRGVFHQVLSWLASWFIDLAISACCSYFLLNRWLIFWARVEASKYLWHQYYVYQPDALLPRRARVSLCAFRFTLHITCAVLFGYITVPSNVKIAWNLSLSISAIQISSFVEAEVGLIIVFVAKYIFDCGNV